MPELPELEVVRQVLQLRAVGATIESIAVLPPGGAIVVRDLTHLGFSGALTGATITSIARRGKFLIFALKSAGASSALPLCLIINELI
jgi:formamidopyrimidine-DNA glycosylase